MTGSEGFPDIDPTVDEYMEKLVSDMTSNPAPSKTFGDETVVDPGAKSQLLPGETIAEAHLRLQRERRERNEL